MAEFGLGWRRGAGAMGLAFAALLGACGGGGGDGGGDDDVIVMHVLAAKKPTAGGVDRIAPSLKISSPAATSTADSGSIALSGMAFDDRRVARVRWASSSGKSGVAVLAKTSTAPLLDRAPSVPWRVPQVKLVEGLNTITVTAYDAQGNSSSQSVSVAYGGAAAAQTPPESGSPTAAVDALGLAPCEASGLGRDYPVGDGEGQIASLDQVPWESLAAGDTVRIFHRSEPYRGKILLAARGRADAPVRVCGVKSADGQRPVIDAEDAVARRGLSYTAASLDDIQETRSLVLVDRLGSQDWGTAFPSHVQIDGLELRGARPGHRFTNSKGAVQEYVDFGACIWVERGHDVTIADNVIHDCTNGVFSRSTDDGDFAQTRGLRVAGNVIYGNGVVGDEHQHNSYLQSFDVVVEYNRYGPLRAGALGNALKDRSVGSVIRFNRIEEGAHAIDLVEAEDFPVAALADAAYRSAFVYGNQIVKDGSTGSVIHYGGDHYGSTPGAAWGEPLYRRGTLYFFHNTVLVTGGAGNLFQLSTTLERAEVWNNVLAFAASVRYPSLRQNSEVGGGWTAGGVVNLGRNWINANWADSDPWHAIPGSVIGAGNLVTGTSLPIDMTTLMPLAGSIVIDAAQAGPETAQDFAVNRQLDAAYRAQSRPVMGAAPDLGALER